MIVPSFSFETGPMVVQEAIFSGTISLVPNIGGSNEFHEQFPEMVVTYEWNNLESLIEKIEILKNSISKNNSSYRQSIELGTFLEAHLNLYNSN